MKKLLDGAARSVIRTTDTAVSAISNEVRTAANMVATGVTRKRDSVTVGAAASASSTSSSPFVAPDTSSSVFAKPPPAAVATAAAAAKGGRRDSHQSKTSRKKKSSSSSSSSRWLFPSLGRSREKKRLGRLSTEIAAGSQGRSAPPGFKRIQSHKSGPLDFEHIRFAQELDSQHLGPIWCIRFSRCGQLLATAGQDTTIRIWVVKDAYKQFKGTGGPFALVGLLFHGP